MILITADIGGTHARFALAEIKNGVVVFIQPPVMYKTTEHKSLNHAFLAFEKTLISFRPSILALAVACPLTSEILEFTNNNWAINKTTIAYELQFETVYIVNDFEAVGHAVAQISPNYLLPIIGTLSEFNSEDRLSVIGLGTGLGVCQLIKTGSASYVLPTETGHVSFCPSNEVEHSIHAKLVHKYGRVSVERLMSGPGLRCFMQAIIPHENLDTWSDAQIWEAALGRSNEAASNALTHFLSCFGSVIGDISLAHGSNILVLVGSLTERMAAFILKSPFYERFIDKGRMRKRQETVKIFRMNHIDPGLVGAALSYHAFVQK